MRKSEKESVEAAGFALIILVAYCMFMIGILLLFAGCGPSIEQSLDYVQPGKAQFERERRYFEHHTGHETGYIPISYGELGPATIAKCWARTYKGRMHYKQIIVNRKNYDELSPEWKRAIIAHELIHCHLELMGHTRQRSVPPNLDIMAAQLGTPFPLREADLIRALEPYQEGLYHHRP